MKENIAHGKRGFALISVLLAAALGVIVLMGLAQGMTAFQREVAGIRLELEFVRFGNLPTLFIAYPAACTSAISGQPFVVGGSTPIVYKDVSGTLISAGTIFNSMTFTKVQLSDLGTTGIPNQYNASITFQARKPQGAGGPPMMNLVAQARILLNAGLVQICF